jgi:chromosomal replication initiator protein
METKKRLILPPDLIIQKIKDRYKVGNEIFEKSRKKEIVEIRQLCQFYLRKHTLLSLAKIGEITGNYNHATVLYSVQVINDIMQVYKGKRDEYEGIGFNQKTKTLKKETYSIIYHEKDV